MDAFRGEDGRGDGIDADMTTYGLVVALVAVAAFTALVASMADRPEWRLPGRRRPSLALMTIEGGAMETARASDPSRPAWEAALAEVFTGDGSAGSAGAHVRTSTPLPIAEVIALRPRLTLVDGMSALTLAGTPIDTVRDEITAGVAALAGAGSRSVVLGMATPAADTVRDRTRGSAAASHRRQAQRTMIDSWNEAVAADIAPFGAVLVADPRDLPGTVARLTRSSFVPDLADVDLPVAAGVRRDPT